MYNVCISPGYPQAVWLDCIGLNTKGYKLMLLKSKQRVFLYLQFCIVVSVPRQAWNT